MGALVEAETMIASGRQGAGRDRPHQSGRIVTGQPDDCSCRLAPPPAGRMARRTVTPRRVALEFVARINEHDLGGLRQLMTSDHALVDALGIRIRGRQVVLQAWAEYFRVVPDYWVRIDDALQHRDVVALFGAAGGTCSGSAPRSVTGSWGVPGAWRFLVRGPLAAAWHVYADSLPLRRLMGLGGA